MPEQLSFDLFPSEKTPDQCSAIIATVDVGGGHAQCGAYEDGKTWTNCIEMGHCTLGCGPR